MPEAKTALEGLMDFSFRVYATPRMLKFLYALHLLAGLVAASNRSIVICFPHIRV